MSDPVTWAEMVPPLSIRVPDCPHFTIEEALKDAAQTFYRDTRAWRVEDVDLGTTFADERDYAIVETPEIEVIGIPQAWIDGEEVDELAGEESSESSTAADETIYPTPPMKIGVSGPAAFRIVPAPTSTGWQITGTVAYAPAADCTGIPYRLWRQHRQAIEAAALADLTSMQGKPWYDPGASSRWDSQASKEALRWSTEAGPRRRKPQLRVKVY